MMTVIKITKPENYEPENHPYVRDMAIEFDNVIDDVLLDEPELQKQFDEKVKKAMKKSSDYDSTTVDLADAIMYASVKGLQFNEMTPELLSHCANWINWKLAMKYNGETNGITQ